MENNEFVANYDYHQMNKYWLNIHSKTNYIATGINCITEICMFLVFHDSFLLNCSPISHIIRNILLPTSICFGICVACTISEKSLKLSLKQKQYIISFLSLCIAFVIASIHNAFVESLMALTLPMIFTILYEDKKLIYFIACASIVFQLISGLFIQFDSSKVLNSLYVLNMTIIIIFTFILFILSCNMMKFIHIRRIVIIKNEIERFELQKKVFTDSLTSVGNKMSLMNEMSQMIQEQKDCFCIMFDIDKFKDINDSYGHVYGDETLQRVGRILLELSPPYAAFRYGGDEFCLLLDMSLLQVDQLMKKIQNYLKKQKRRSDVCIKISVGIAQNKNYSSVEEWMNKADQALYESKSKGGDMITYYDIGGKL